MTTRAVPGLDVLPRQECLQLLGGVATGWLVFSSALRPRMVMVNVVLRDGEVLVRTGPGDAVSAAENGAVMTVGVSATDESSHTGWSVTVTVTGTARVLDRLPAPRDDGGELHPWAPGTKDHVLVVPLEDVTGRRVTAGAPLGSGQPAWGWWG